jgi:predicted HicB family RNase H-like nuclease
MSVKRKPGRPKLPKGKAKGKIVPIRFTKAEAEHLAEAAKKNGQTLSDWIRHTLVTALET